MKKQVACQYAIARFLPYAETGEFANVGIVIACPELGLLRVKFAPLRRTKRITDFFEGLNPRIYRESLRYLEVETSRIASSLKNGPAATKMAFEELTRPREALLRFSSARAILSDDPESTLQTLFEKFIERDFATKEYHEKILNKGVATILAGAALKNYFDPEDVGDEDFNVRFPFVNSLDGSPLIAIKPLHLAQDEPSKIMDHGSHWVARVARLKKHGNMPGNLLFAIDKSEKTKQQRVAKEIITDLKDLGAEVVRVDDERAIVDFAQRALDRSH
ncbi:DUF3037 domain-containing protein [Dyella sp. 333MFSha]|uniref:DUF3037 domain-containing protein n=1 Tax=Dyella sp. 333MFSha TaxID=1798240 RepID=UPI00087E3B4F|nr:DUF3037 domain-containing protein [Dyella sp. 333MFSha]SDG67878.1 Protein of unknown function [Dyella sp. 333MFSha]